MLDKVIHKAYEENTTLRRATLQPLKNIETIIELSSLELEEGIFEDDGRQLRK
jgi:hypothetical protein